MALRSEPDVAVKLKEADSLDMTPTSEELAAMLRQALHEADTGQTRPAGDVMREIREMLAEDADACASPAADASPRRATAFSLPLIHHGSCEAGSQSPFRYPSSQ